MKFLTFTDLHEDKEVLNELVQRASKSDIDFVVCCGDISTFGNGLRFNLKKFNSLGKKVYVIPGNHEEGPEFDAVVAEFSNVVNLDRKARIVGDYIFLGYGGGGVVFWDAGFTKNCWGRDGGNVGNKDFTAFTLRIKPKLALSGHLHETVGEIDVIGETKIANPGWEGMVIELN